MTVGSGGGSVQPPTMRTIGMPISRKTTSAERGLPGSPMTGTPPQSASSVGLPGRNASPWHQMPGSPSDAMAAAVSSREPTDDPAETTTRQPGTTLPEGSDSSSLAQLVARAPVVGHDAREARLAAGFADERGEGGRGGVADLADPNSARRERTSSSPVDTIATRGRAYTGTPTMPAAASIPRSCARSGRPGGASSSPGAASSSARTIPSPGVTGFSTSSSSGVADCVCSTLSDRVGAGRERCAGRDGDRGARADLGLRRAAHVRLAREVEVARSPSDAP